MNTNTRNINDVLQNSIRKIKLDINPRQIRLLKVGSLTGLSTLIKIASGFVINKVIAVYIGPSGVALLGQFQNFVNIIRSFSNGSVNNGIIKYVAEYYDNKDKQDKILSTAFALSLLFSLICTLFLIFYKDQLSLYLLKTDKYGDIFFLLGITTVLFSLNNLFISIMNGFKEIKKYVLLNITSNLGALIFTTILVIHMGLYGALVSFIWSQVVIFVITVFYIVKCKWFNFRTFFNGIDSDSARKLAKYSGMAIVSAIVASFSQILVRNHIASTISMDAAGYWQGVWKISEVYLLFITTTLSIYYLPRLSEIKDRFELKKEIVSSYKIILPAVSLVALTIYICRNWIINILFSSEFMPMSELFAFQLLGDFIKISSWLLAFVMIAKAMTFYFIATEIIFTVSFVLISLFFIDHFGLVGATYGFALNYLLYLLAVVWIFRDLLFLKKSG